MNQIREVRLFSAGSCRQKEAFSIRGGAWRDVEFPAACAVLKHPTVGWILYDTGYAPDILTSSSGVGMRLYARIMKVVSNEETSVVSRLRGLGIEPEEVALVVLSHFHPDHIGGVRFFSNARFLCSKKGYREACRRSRRLGFRRELLPYGFEERLDFVEDRAVVPHAGLSCFGVVYDLFADGSVLSVLIDGHAPRQVGCLIRGSEQSCFLVADAAWSRKAIEEGRPPHGITRLIQDDWGLLLDNLFHLGELARANPSWRIVPSHCQQSLQESVYGLDGR